jgi:hypothetical protein
MLIVSDLLRYMGMAWKNGIWVLLYPRDSVLAMTGSFREGESDGTTKKIWPNTELSGRKLFC